MTDPIEIQGAFSVYTYVPHSSGPNCTIRWDVPRRYQGQVVEISFSADYSAGESDVGSIWIRKRDQSIAGHLQYYRLASVTYPDGTTAKVGLGS